MQTDEQKRADFISYLKQLKQKWVINSETERNILLIILSHKDSKLDAYIARFKVMIEWMEKGIKNKPDKFSEEPPLDGEYIVSFVGADVTTRSYYSNCALRLFFSRAKNEIYKFEVLL
jgi:CTP synthase (UTP-ammonia lyase)